jgi:hypothetical protein
MSTAPTATTTVSTDLSDAYYRESTSAFRFTLWVSFFVILFSLLSSFISRLCFNACATSIMGRDMTYKPVRFKMPMYEDFTNETEEQSEFKFDYKNASKYQSIPLTSPEDPPSTLMVGQVNRYLNIENGKSDILIEIFANLYILGGNIYGETKKDQVYNVYAYTNDNKKIDFGILTKSQDGFYKLKIKSNDPRILEFNKVEIVYKTSESETTILTGKFSKIL